jgi:hypothetical protein
MSAIHWARIGPLGWVYLAIGTIAAALLGGSLPATGKSGLPHP